ncbi:Uma2 family endonuclease [Actinoallomurus iriomotensis]|nr:Uma2 family endonuclease [Actinoallomurus iriomotensis]
MSLKFHSARTIDDAAAKNGMRYELVEGRLVVSAVPPPPHQVAGARLTRILDAAAPGELETGLGTNLRIGADMLIPDVMLANSEALRAPAARYLDSEDVLLVVEMISPGATFERAWKPRWYAQGGIRFYLEIEFATAPGVSVHELRGGEYERVAEAKAGETLKLVEPFPVSFDPGELVGPRRSAG